MARRLVRRGLLQRLASAQSARARGRRAAGLTRRLVAASDQDRPRGRAQQPPAGVSIQRLRVSLRDEFVGGRMTVPASSLYCEPSLLARSIINSDTCLPSANPESRSLRKWMPPQSRKVDPYKNIARVELDCLIEVSDGGGKIALIASRPAAVAPGSGIARVELNCVTEVVDRRIKFAKLAVDDSAIDVGVGVSRVQPDGFQVNFRGALDR